MILSVDVSNLTYFQPLVKFDPLSAVGQIWPSFNHWSNLNLFQLLVKSCPCSTIGQILPTFNHWLNLTLFQPLVKSCLLSAIDHNDDFTSAIGKTFVQLTNARQTLAEPINSMTSGIELNLLSWVSILYRNKRFSVAKVRSNRSV